jgi:hypothetical protein
LTSYRTIALSSTLCKLTEHIIKTRLDWWVENLLILTEKLFGFRKGRGTLECFSCLVGPIYDAFNSRDFLTAAFIDIRSAYESVHIPKLLTILHSYSVTASLVHFIGLLLFTWELIFISLLGSQSCQTTHTGLP